MVPSRFIYTAVIFLWAHPKIPWAQGSFENFQKLSVEDGLPHRHVYDVAFDRYGIAWLGTGNGLAMYDGSKITEVDQTTDEESDLQGQPVYALFYENDTIWLGTDQGLSILDINTLTYHEVVMDLYKENASDHSLHIRDIIKDRSGDLWLCLSFHGFVKMDRKNLEMTSYPINVDPQYHSNYTRQERSSLTKVIQDNEQDSIMWGVGITGIYRLNGETGLVKHIYYDKGSLTDRFNVNRKATLFQGNDGIIYTGAWNAGLSYFDPQNQIYYTPHLENKSFPLSFKQHLYNIQQKDEGHLYLTFSDGLYLFSIKDQAIKLLKANDAKTPELQFGVDFIDEGGRLWNTYSRGVTILNPLVNQFNWYSFEEVNNLEVKVLPRILFEDALPGYVTVLGQYTDGIYHVNLEDPKDIIEVPPPFPLHHLNGLSIWGAAQISDDEILLTAAEKIYSFDISHARFKEFDIQPPSFTIYNSLFKDDRQRIWIGTASNGLYTLENNQLYAWQDQIASRNTRLKLMDSNGQLWMILDKGFAKINTSNDKLTIYDPLTDLSNSFTTTTDFCECPNEEVWVSGYDQGLGWFEPGSNFQHLNKVEIRESEFEFADIIGVACNPQNEVWAISSKGLYLIDKFSHQHPFFDFAYGVKESEDLFQFLKNGDLFLGGRDGFYTVNTDMLMKNGELPKPYVIGFKSNIGRQAGFKQLMEHKRIELQANDNLAHIDFSAINYSLSSQIVFEYKLEGLDKDWIQAKDRRSVTYAYLEGGDYTFKIRAANNEGVWNPEQYHLPISVAHAWYETIYFYLAVSFSIGLIGYWLYRFKIGQIRKEEKLRSSYEKRLSEVKMNALQAQMNPHFIFNSLNSIDASIVRNDTKKASEYLNDFSRLIRLILQNSRSAYVLLEDDLEALQLYVKMEQIRLKYSFDFQLNISPSVQQEIIEIPPMMLQPFVENAIWHGLSALEKRGRVDVSISRHTNHLVTSIEDNGIGRVAAKKMKEAKKIKRKSMGMSITTERLDMMNALYGSKNQIEILDLYDSERKASGTRVIIKIPI